MALITRDASASMDGTTAQKASHIPDLLAGEAIDLVSPCFINSSDGEVYMSNGTAADEDAEFVGFSARAAGIGEPVSVYGPGVRFRYAASGLTPGAKLYVGATAGRLDDAPTVGDNVGIAFVVSATDIMAMDYKVAPIVPATQALTPDNDSGAASSINAGVTAVAVGTVANGTTDWIVLPAFAANPIGFQILIDCAAGGAFEMRTVAASGTTINGVDSDGPVEYLCTDTEIIVVTKHADGYIATGYSAAGAIVTAVVPD